MKTQSTYYTWSHNIDGCLRNGSYVARRGKTRLVQYMNGDYMGDIPAVPEGMTEVDPALAKKLLPSCCGYPHIVSTSYVAGIPTQRPVKPARSAGRSSSLKIRAAVAKEVGVENPAEETTTTRIKV